MFSVKSLQIILHKTTAYLNMVRDLSDKPWSGSSSLSFNLGKAGLKASGNYYKKIKFDTVIVNTTRMNQTLGWA